jgi:hypothetical protein
MNNDKVGLGTIWLSRDLSPSLLLDYTKAYLHSIYKKTEEGIA